MNQLKTLHDLLSKSPSMVDLEEFSSIRPPLNELFDITAVFAECIEKEDLYGLRPVLAGLCYYSILELTAIPLAPDMFSTVDTFVKQGEYVPDVDVTDMSGKLIALMTASNTLDIIRGRVNEAIHLSEKGNFKDIMPIVTQIASLSRRLSKGLGFPTERALVKMCEWKNPEIAKLL